MNMKPRYLLLSLLTAIAGGAITLFAYTRIIEKPDPVISGDTASVQAEDAKGYLASYQVQDRFPDFTVISEQAVHAVVHVHTKSMVGQPSNPLMEWFYGDRYSRPREVSGYGSGVIISADGYIITNNHVIDGAENVEVTLNDKRVLQATIVGKDPTTDIALLKVKGTNLPFLKYGSSDLLKLGEWVLAVGNPFNLTSTVTAGIVSAKGRSLNLLEGDYKIESFIQTDAALNMGNSGGALINIRGELVGITTAIISPSGAYAGNSFAVPVSIVQKVVADLREFGEVQRALIGVNIRDVNAEDAEKMDLREVKGILITNIVEGGSAEDAGLKANDVIVKFNGQDVASVPELQEQVSRRRPGDRANLTFVRNGKEETVPIVLKNSSGTTNIVKTGEGVEVVYGAKLEPLTMSEKGRLKVDHGVKITEISDGKFRDFGMKRGYIILTINGKKIKNPAEIKQITDSEEDKVESIGGLFIQSDGSVFRFQFGN
ncbi:MAG: Do family serine endopeptidase, partial [Bacteroidales bacterium]|nr:Do family serine endopeptidase [Bacteroidales bacterium]